VAIRIPGKLVFLRHPRTGSSATAAALSKLGGIRVGDGQHQFVKAGKNEITVSTIRNPFDVLATWFILNMKYDKMEDFLRKYTHSDFRRRERLFYFAEYSDILLLYDKLQKQFNELMLSLRLSPTRIYRINTTSDKRPFMDYFDEKTIAIVEEMFVADLEVYRALSQHGGTV